MSLVISVDNEFPADWDSFVEAHPFGWVTHLSSWKDAIQKTFNHIQANCIIAHDTTSGRIVAGLPIYLCRNWFSHTRLVSIPFATLCDPLMTQVVEPQLFWNEALSFRNQLHASYLEVRSCQYRLPEIPGLQYHISNKFRYHWLSLDESLDKIFSRLHRKAVRPPIKKAMSQGMVVERLSTFKDLETFYGLYKNTRRRLGLPVIPILFYRALWQALNPKGSILLLGAFLHGNCIAALLLFVYKDRVSAEAVGWNENYADRSTPSLLYWEAIKYAHARGCRVFDFGRTDSANVGLMDYKGRWGTKVEPLPIYYLGKKQRNRVVDASYRAGLENEWLRKLIRHSPHWIYVGLGKLWYNHFA
jgi:hypothetical protein